jgi:hypothetical protein
MTDGIYAFDLLLPVRPLLPWAWTCPCGATLGPYTPLRDCRTKPDAHAGCRAKAEAERTARATAEFEAAIAAWRQVCDQYADTPAVLVVLNLHQPTLGHASAECEHCERYDGTEQVPWPCPTYVAVRDATAAEPDACADAPDAAEVLPEVGSIVHVWRPDDVLGGCAPLRVAGHHTTAPGVDTILILDGPLPWNGRTAQYLTMIHDEKLAEHGSWHWPCDGDQEAEPEPRPLAPTTLTIELDIRGATTINHTELQAVISHYLLHRR